MDETIRRNHDRVDRARELWRDRRATALLCGCDQRCVRCRTGLRAASRVLLRALQALDDAQDVVEQRKYDSGSIGSGGV